MIHHFSIPVQNTRHVSIALAKLFNGTITGFGPYENSYIVWFGDEYGTAIELFPNGTEMIPDQRMGQANFIHNQSHSEFSATHAAISIKQSREEMLGIAEELGWRALELSRGGFNVIEFWIENSVMIELLTPDMADQYLLATKRFSRQLPRMGLLPGEYEILSSHTASSSPRSW